MTRYRRELTHSERDFARLAEEARKLREEMQAMVKHRRRADLRNLEIEPLPSKPRKRR